MSEFRAATRYAKSLIELSNEQGILEEVYSDMVMVDNTCSENRELALVLKSPIISHSKKYQILEAIFKDKVSELTKSFYQLIGRKGREKIFHQVTKEFRKQYLELKGIEKVSVVTTFSLDSDLRDQITEIARNISGKEPQLDEKVDVDIIGGYILNVGSSRIDASVRSKLRKLRKELVK